MRVARLWHSGHLTAVGFVHVQPVLRCPLILLMHSKETAETMAKGPIGAIQQRSPGMEPCVFLQPLPGCCRDAGRCLNTLGAQRRPQPSQDAESASWVTPIHAGLLLLLSDCISLFTLASAPHESRKGLGPSTKPSDVLCQNSGMKRKRDATK